MQVASVMGLNSVALDLLLLIHPMSIAQAEDQVLSSSRQDLKNDMQELESAGFLKPCKDTPDSWEFAQVTPNLHSFPFLHHTPPHPTPLPPPSQPLPTPTTLTAPFPFPFSHLDLLLQNVLAISALWWTPMSSSMSLPAQASWT